MGAGAEEGAARLFKGTTSVEMIFGSFKLRVPSPLLPFRRAAVCCSLLQHRAHTYPLSSSCLKSKPLVVRAGCT